MLYVRLYMKMYQVCKMLNAMPLPRSGRHEDHHAVSDSIPANLLPLVDQSHLPWLLFGSLFPNTDLRQCSPSRLSRGDELKFQRLPLPRQDIDETNGPLTRPDKVVRSRDFDQDR